MRIKKEGGDEDGGRSLGLARSGHPAAGSCRGRVLQQAHSEAMSFPAGAFLVDIHSSNCCPSSFSSYKSFSLYESFSLYKTFSLYKSFSFVKRDNSDRGAYPKPERRVSVV